MKRGSLTIDQVVKLILAVAVVFLLLFLVVRLFVPFFDKGDETAKSYLEILEKQIKIADSGKTGEIFLWGIGDSEREYYIVYFGDAIKVDGPTKKVMDFVPEDTMGATSLQDKEIWFNSLGKNENRICVCFVDGNKDDGYKSTCKSCEDLKYPVVFADKNSQTWYEGGSSRLSIKLDELDKLGGDKYVFERIK